MVVGIETAAITGKLVWVGWIRLEEIRGGFFCFQPGPMSETLPLYDAVDSSGANLPVGGFGSGSDCGGVVCVNS